MNVIESLSARRSIRAFLSTPVEKEKLDAILRAADRSPSWANSQPWETFVATGATLEKIRTGYQEKREQKAKAAPETPSPVEWPEACVKRREQLMDEMKRDCGDSVSQFGALNRDIFHAPAAIYICVDKVLGEWAMYDIGAYSQSLMLAAVELGLGAIQAATMMLYPDVLRSAMVIPDNLRLAIGIAVGYEDKENGINKLVSGRKPFDETVRYFD